MSKTVKTDIENLTLTSTNDVQDSKIRWDKNHGKFIHEYTFKHYKRDLLTSVNNFVHAIQNNLKAFNAKLRTSLTDLNTDIEQETTRATKAEADLSNKIDNESSRAKQAETGLGDRIGALETADFAKQLSELRSEVESLKTK